MYYFICEYCGKKVEVKYKSKIRRFCSNACSVRSHNNHKFGDAIYVDKECANCGGIITMLASDHRIKRGQEMFFCNHRCENEYKKIINPHKEQKCPICERTFIKRLCAQKTCSKECRYKLGTITRYNNHFNTNLTYSEYIEIKQKEEAIKEAKRNSPLKRVGREKEYMREYASTTKNKERRKELEIKRLENNPIYKATVAIRKNICSYIKRFGEIKNKKHTEDILGCDFQTFKAHIEKLFTSEMNWDNYGSKWHIDHIIPISLAENLEDFYILNNYTNLQPMLVKDNIQKRNKIIPNVVNIIKSNCVGYEDKCEDLIKFARRKNL